MAQSVGSKAFYRSKISVSMPNVVLCILPLSDVIHWTGFFPSISMIIQMATKGHDSDQAILLSFVRPSPLFLM
jgi:hypothetical protein